MQPGERSCGLRLDHRLRLVRDLVYLVRLFPQFGPGNGQTPQAEPFQNWTQQVLRRTTSHLVQDLGGALCHPPPCP